MTFTVPLLFTYFPEHCLLCSLWFERVTSFFSALQSYLMLFILRLINTLLALPILHSFTGLCYSYRVLGHSLGSRSNKDCIAVRVLVMYFNAFSLFYVSSRYNLNPNLNYPARLFSFQVYTIALCIAFPLRLYLFYLLFTRFPILSFLIKIDFCNFVVLMHSHVTAPSNLSIFNFFNNF